jgi:hypothetical protein
MEFNLETIFDQVPAAEGATPAVTSDKGDYSVRVIQLFSEAKQDGVTLYDIIETAFLQLGIERRQAAETEGIIATTEDNFDGADAGYRLTRPFDPEHVVTDEEASSFDPPTDAEVAASFIEDVQAAEDESAWASDDFGGDGEEETAMRDGITLTGVD